MKIWLKGEINYPSSIKLITNTLTINLLKNIKMFKGQQNQPFEHQN